MSCYEVRSETLSDLSGRLATAADDLGAAFGTVVAAAPSNAGATTAALASVLDRVVLDVAGCWAIWRRPPSGSTPPAPPTRPCEEGNATLFRQFDRLPWEGGR